jgi:hypothetical protein
MFLVSGLLVDSCCDLRAATNKWRRYVLVARLIVRISTAHELVINRASQ